MRATSARNSLAASGDLRTTFGLWLSCVCLAQVGVDKVADRWLRCRSTIGSAEALMAKAKSLGQVWMKGISGELAKKILRERPT